MISNEGKAHIKRYLAGLVPSIAQSIAFGVGGRAESATDTAMHFEVGRSDIAITSYDFVNDKLIFKASVPDDLGGLVYEAGLFSLPANIRAGQYGSRLISTFDSASENWMQGANPATFEAANARIGDDGLLISAAASGSITVELTDIYFDFSQNSGADKFSFAFNQTGNLSSIRYRLMTNAANYYDFTISSGISSGYNIISRDKSTATVTGSPDWGSITTIQVTGNATAGGALNLTLDGIRLEDTDTISPDYVMVAREVLSTPFIKKPGMTQEVEFTLDVNV